MKMVNAILLFNFFFRHRRYFSLRVYTPGLDSDWNSQLVISVFQMRGI